MQSKSSSSISSGARAAAQTLNVPIERLEGHPGRSPPPATPHDKSHRDADHHQSANHNHIEHNGKPHPMQSGQMMMGPNSRDEIMPSSHSAKHLPPSPVQSPQHMTAHSQHHNGNGIHGMKNGGGGGGGGVHTNGVAVLPTTPSMGMQSGGGGGQHIDTDDQDDQQQFSSLSAMHPQPAQNTKFSLIHFAMQHFRDE